MKALAIDSAVTRLVIAAKNDDYTVSAVYDIGMKQSETLLPAADYILGKAGLKPADLDYTAICQGPGSFTGLRLGFAALKAIEHAEDIPLYGIPTLEAYAYPFRGLPFPVISVIDAKKDKFYVQAAAGEKELLPAGDYEMTQALKPVLGFKEVIVCGPDAALFASQAAEGAPRVQMHVMPFCQVTTDALFAIAEKDMAEGIPPLKDFDGPLYLRASEAEEHLGA